MISALSHFVVEYWWMRVVRPFALSKMGKAVTTGVRPPGKTEPPSDVFFLIGCAFVSAVVSYVLCCSTFASFDPSNSVFADLLPSHIASLCGYWLLGTLCLALDLVLPKQRILQYKTQGCKSLFSLREWLEAVKVSMINLHVFGPAFSVPLWLYFWRDRFYTRWENVAFSNGIFKAEFFPTLNGSGFDYKQELLNLLVHALVVDMVFYWTHRAIHSPLLYGPIHKMHHRFKAPVAVASMYAHPFEFVFGNLAGVVLGPCITNCHPRHILFWFCFTLMTTGGSHSGYYFFGAQKHDRHHQYFHCNFGVGLHWDLMFQTDYDSWKQGLPALPERWPRLRLWGSW